MAAYPSFPQLVGSKPKRLGGQVVERALSGKPRIRSYYTQTRKEWEVVHELLAADKETLLAFYEANKNLTFDFTWQGDGSVHQCRFAEAPDEEPVTGVWYKVVCQIIEM